MTAAGNETSQVEPVRVDLAGELSFRWHEPWNGWLAARDAAERAAWIHAGIAVTAAGDVVAISHDSAEAVLLAPDGSVRRSFPTGVTQGHGLLSAVDGAGECLWVADNGVRRERTGAGEYPNVPGGARHGRVLKLSLSGQPLLALDAPELPAYVSGSFYPTAVAVDEPRFGGDGAVWVADGYGQSLVHKFTADGRYLLTLDGTDGAGRFACPHAIWIDRRRAQPEMYIADRTNARLQVYDLDGRFLRAVGGPGIFRRPGGFAAVGDYLVVAELEARLAVLDPADRLVGYLGADDLAGGRDGFPNRLDRNGLPRRPAPLAAGRFNSPHGITSDAGGSLYISEFLIGGRLVKLENVTAAAGGGSAG